MRKWILIHLALIMLLILAGCIFTNDEDPPPSLLPFSKIEKAEHSFSSAPSRTDTTLAFDFPIAIKSGAEQNKLVQFWIEDTNKKIWKYEINFSNVLESKWNSQHEFNFLNGFLQTYYLHRGVVKSQNRTIQELFMSTGDRFTQYFDSVRAADIYKMITSTESDKIIGITMKLSKNADSIYVNSVIPSSPAERAGLKEGDLLLSINDKNLVFIPDSNNSPTKVFKNEVEFANMNNQPIVLKFLQKGTVFSKLITPEAVSLPTVYTDSISPNVSYLSIQQFVPKTIGNLSTGTEFIEAVKKTSWSKTSILDLRDNGGGTINDALMVLENILPSDTAFIEYSKENSDIVLLKKQLFLTKTGDLGENRKWVVLMNKNSASSSEIVIVGLKDVANAKLVGTTSYGKGIGQFMIPTPSSGLALITALKGHGKKTKYHGVGINPDYSIADPDEQLTKAISLAENSNTPIAKRSSISRVKYLAQAINLNRSLTKVTKSPLGYKILKFNK